MSEIKEKIVIVAQQILSKDLDKKVVVKLVSIDTHKGITFQCRLDRTVRQWHPLPISNNKCTIMLS